MSTEPITTAEHLEAAREHLRNAVAQRDGSEQFDAATRHLLKAFDEAGIALRLVKVSEPARVEAA